MIVGSLARRYARALFGVGQNEGTAEKLRAELDILGNAFVSARELETALTSTSFPRQERRGVLEALLARAGASKHTHNFCLLLLERERVGYLPAIARELGVMVDEVSGRVRATIESAKALSAADTKKLQAVLEKATGKHVSLETSTHPELIGGVVAKVGDLVFDGSIRTQLERMRERFLSS